MLNFESFDILEFNLKDILKSMFDFALWAPCICFKHFGQNK